MITAVVDDRDQRRAQARAEALSILDTPTRVRRFQAVPGVRLQPSGRPRAHARPRPAPSPRRRRPVIRRLVAALLVISQVALLVLALTLPVFQIRGAQVTGLHLLRTTDVLDAAGVSRQSIFTFDSQAVSRRVDALPWVASATVTSSLPASVRIQVTERPVALRVRRGGQDVLVAGNGAVMPAGAAAAPPAPGAVPLLDDRAGSAQPLDPHLIQDLAAIAQHFPAVFGAQVVAYQWGLDDILSLWTGTGWKAVLGHLDTQDAFAGLPAQMAALADLRVSLDFAHPTFGYVDLEDPSAPAVGGSAGLPAVVQAAAQDTSAPAAAPATAGVPPPNPLPTPTPKPSPSGVPAAAGGPH